MEELNSASDSEINRFTESDMLDSDDDTIVADNSGMSDIGSSSSSDKQETEEEDGHKADNEYGDYRDNLIDEVIGKQLDRNPPNWSPNNYQDFIVPDYTGPPDTPNLPAGFDISTAKAIDYFSLYFTQQLFEDMVQHTNNYARYCILKKRQLQPNYVDKLWALDGSNNVTVPELKAHFGILIILGINPVKQCQMAFSSDPFLGNEGI